MDTMTMTKLVGAACGALLVFMLGSWAAESIYHVGGAEYAHAEGEEVARPYLIVTAEEEGGGEAEVVEIAFEEVYAAADPAAGEGVFRQCSACHHLEPGANGTGPHLYAVVGRAAHAAEGYAYSAAMMEQDYAWDLEHLNAFLEDPQGYVPGTKMTYRGLADVEDRANLIAYLATIGG